MLAPSALFGHPAILCCLIELKNVSCCYIVYNQYDRQGVISVGYDFCKISTLIGGSGIPRKKFFAKIGITEKAFDEWSAGTAIPKEEVIKRIAKQLNVSLHELREAIVPDVSINKADPPPAPAKSVEEAAVFCSNFHFLANSHPKLYACGETAERLYLGSFFTQCITQLGVFGEFLVEKILSDLELDDFFGVNHYERLRILLDEEHVPLKWFEILDRLRLARNDALHNHVSFNKTEAQLFLRQTYDLARWFGYESGVEVPKDGFVEPFNDVAPAKERLPAPERSADQQESPREAVVPITEKCDFLFTDKEDGLCITSYIGNDTVVDVPDKIQGKKVLEIGEQAFQNCSTIERIFIPASVRTIGTCAFAWCENLVELKGATYLKFLGKRAFYRCANLKAVAPMVSLSHIGKETFAGCSSLGSFFFCEKLEGIASFAFSGCSSLREFVASDGLILIGDRAFSDCSGLLKVIIPDTVTSIGEEAFFNCNNIVKLQKPSHSVLGRDAFGTNLPVKPKTVPAPPQSGAQGSSSNGSLQKTDPARDLERLLGQHDRWSGRSRSENDVHASVMMSLCEYLEYRGLEVIDKRPYRGRLWVVGTEESIGKMINDAKQIFRIGGTYCSGGRATGYRPGWFTASLSTEKRSIPQERVEIDYNEVTSAGELYKKYFGKIDGLLILEDEAWTNEYCFVVDRRSDDGKKLEGVCYCNGRFQRYYSYAKTRRFKVFDGSTADTIRKIHGQYRKA